MVAVRIATADSSAEAERLLAPIRAVAKALNDTITQRPYSDIVDIYDEPTTPVPVQKDFSLVHSLPHGAIDALTQTAGPGSGSPMLLVELRRLGGAFANSSAAPSAFSHRQAAYSLMSVGLNVPPEPEIVAEASARIHAGVTPWAIDGAFANLAPASVKIGSEWPTTTCRCDGYRP